VPFSTLDKEEARETSNCAVPTSNKMIPKLAAVLLHLHCYLAVVCEATFQQNQHTKQHGIRGAGITIDDNVYHTIETTSLSSLRCATATADTTEPCSSSIIQWLDESQPRKDAERELYQYLYSNMMSFDVPNAESIGFHSHPSDKDLPDGLSSGIVEPTITLALDAKQKYPWTSHVPKHLYFEYVGAYASVNEARNNWRPLFYESLQDIIQALMNNSILVENVTVEQVIRELNQNMWDNFNTKRPIYFQSGQTPLIYDPMSILAFGYASCTGLSIVLIDALRTFGIPARLAGTPAWNGKKDNGNHSWIEFFGSDSKWHIMESKPASNGKDDDLFDPCQWWFCNEDRVQETHFYAARLERSHDSDSFPLAWDPGNDGVSGENRTQFMNDLCSQC